ncbi:pentapeptide repeat-containing protein [Paenibacillus antarcticus]|uniref:Pentapeptide repeat-containing protein n=1 Tax=Paenibacillus antarcticus TaxID=253703 RepID=A0A162MCL2_9BACL|nr:pentapeptide repeat-containing protein [Paenibacillus antarcticus]OAB47155.1 hypothetical protein PBAT_07710 [Paenibacillus antarcticus]
MERLELVNTNRQLDVRNTNLTGSRFECACLENMHLQDISLAGTKIKDANLSDLEIDGAQLGGAYIHNIGMPPEGHPMYDPTVKQRPLRFENCNLENSQILDCNLSGIDIHDCKLDSMRINGILVVDLLKVYEKTISN